MTSIFRLEEIRIFDSEEHWYRDANTGILGHYSSLKKAVKVIPKNNNETYDAEDIFAYMVKEIAVDGDVGDIRWLSVRSYDTSGNLIEQSSRKRSHRLSAYSLGNYPEG